MAEKGLDTADLAAMVDDQNPRTEDQSELTTGISDGQVAGRDRGRNWLIVHAPEPTTMTVAPTGIKRRESDPFRPPRV
ncbi:MULTISPECIES: hypothetical protein [unclassified Cryobacterium]|uniref:hypothetical protein n=1 Tax=unclassified Cryobacterium TaxID=2649013 RepID=UPI0018CB639E|nr:hypothetical protein [Cryobacterium sp. CAN_C3]